MRILTLALALVIAAAAACGGDDDEAADGGGAGGASDCSYELDGEALTAFPPGLYPASVAEVGEELVVALQDPADPGAELELTVPACLRDEALEIIARREAADAAQAAEGIPPSERTYE